MSVHEIDPKGERAGKIAVLFLRCCRKAARFFGKDFAGFAVVVWDMSGQSDTIICCSQGPISKTLMPTYVHDVLNRHVAITEANKDAADLIYPDEPA